MPCASRLQKAFAPFKTICSCLVDNLLREKYTNSLITRELLEFCPRIELKKKKKKNQSSTSLKKMPKLVLKTIVNDNSFNFNLKTVVTNYGFDENALVRAFFSNLH